MSAEENILKILTNKLKEKNVKLAVAESCTGGLLSSKLTDIPGSSALYERGFITYSNTAKVELLGVFEDTIKEFGAVSRETVVEMANGALNHSFADLAVAITGIAGPSGGTEEKPVGTVFIAVATKSKLTSQKFNFSGDRLEVKEKTCEKALEMLDELLSLI